MRRRWRRARCARATVTSSTGRRRGSPTAAWPMPPSCTRTPIPPREKKELPRLWSSGARWASRWARKKKNWGFTPRRARNCPSPIAKCPLRIASATKAKGTRWRFPRWTGGASASPRRLPASPRARWNSARLREGAASLRPPHRRFSGHPVHAGGHGHGD